MGGAREDLVPSQKGDVAYEMTKYLGGGSKSPLGLCVICLFFSSFLWRLVVVDTRDVYHWHRTHTNTCLGSFQHFEVMTKSCGQKRQRAQKNRCGRRYARVDHKASVCFHFWLKFNVKRVDDVKMFIWEKLHWKRERKKSKLQASEARQEPLVSG